MVTMLITIRTVTTPPGAPPIAAGPRCQRTQEAKGSAAGARPARQCSMAAAW
jgi:hypothetical protein